MVDTQTEIGSPDDRVRFTVDGKPIPYYVNYTVKLAIMAQPSTFTLSLGAGVPGKEQLQAKDLLKLAERGKELKFFIGPTLVQSGVIEDHDVDDGPNGTVLTVSGRDWLAPLTKNTIRHEKDFGNPTYKDLTRQVLDICGLKDRKLYTDNEANRIKISRSTKAQSVPMTDIVEATKTNTMAASGTTVQLQRVIGKIGQTWFEFLKSQYKKVGFFLWATGDGNFVLSRPTGSLDPLYKLVKRRNLPRNMSQVLTRHYGSHTSQRHATTVCFGKGASGAKKLHPMERTWDDFEMKNLGFSDILAVYDSDASTPDEAQYLARRKMGEDRRDGFNLTYTVSGHTVPSLDNSRMLIWAPDTTVTIIDEPLGDVISDDNQSFGTGQDCYIENIEFSRSPQTTTKIRVMRKQDLFFLGEQSAFESAETKPIHGVG